MSMTINMIIIEPDAPDTTSSEHRRINEIITKLSEIGIVLRRTSVAKTENETALRLLKTKGRSALPLVLVNDFVMISGRYPSTDEIKQILNVKDDILEPKQCGCCCIEGCDHGC